MVGILGRNGSGKALLLQIITGTLNPTDGIVETQGRIAALLELGSGFNPDFTGRENVYLNGALLGFTEAQIDEKFDAITAFADIGEHLDQPVKTYSSGMLVRLAFAVQVQVSPDILIVDEALAVGDALFQKRCYQRIEQLVSDGTTVLFVSHDQESIRTLTHRALLLDKGHSIQWGSSSDVVLRYRRLLHDEEAAYYSALAQDITNRARSSSFSHEVDTKAPQLKGSSVSDIPEIANALQSEGIDSERLSFGDGAVKIIQVEILDADGQPCSMFYVGARIQIRVTCQAFTNTDKLNVAIRLRNKEGVKIYSWGTLNQDMSARFNDLDAPTFWERHFNENERFSVLFECTCDLGVNLYEVQAAVSVEENDELSIATYVVLDR